MAYPGSRISLNLPWEILDQSRGFSLDIGGSVIKLLYIAKADWIEPQLRTQGSYGRLTLVNFPRTQIDEVLLFIQSESVIQRDGEDTGVYTTGIGTVQMKDKIETQLNVRCKTIDEANCFVRALVYLIRNLPRNKLLYDVEDSVIKNAHKELEHIRRLLKEQINRSKSAKFGDIERRVVFPQELVTSELMDKTLVEADKDLFPIGMVMGGSCALFLMIHEDLTYEFVDACTRFGRMFLGLGRLLTGAKTYDSLMDFCVNGTSSNVDIQNVCLETSSSAEDDLVKGTGNYSFAQGMEKDIGKFEKADIANSLLKSIITDIVQTTLLNARTNSLKYVFLVGGFFNNPLVRELVAQRWLIEDAKHYLMSPKEVLQTEFHFLPHGSHLGVIGALTNHHMQFIPK